MPGRGLQRGDQLRLLELAPPDDLERLEGGALLPEMLAVGRHRAGRDAADVGVVAAVGDEEDLGHKSAKLFKT